MKKSRILVIGDIHGCLEKLKKLIQKIDYNPKQDKLIFLGDYIDRGPDSSGVIEFVLDLNKKSENIICLIGNHEAMFLNYLDGIEVDFFLMNGGINTINDYGTDENIPESHIEFLNNLKTYYETKTHIFVHAGLRNNIPLKEQSKEDLIWIRDGFIYSKYNHGKTVVFGHTPQSKPLLTELKIGIDTGAVFGGDLTCLEITENGSYYFYGA